MANEAWGTDDELKFIKSGLGGFQEISRPYVLRQYIKGALKREKWGKINRKVVIHAAQKELILLSGGKIC